MLLKLLRNKHPLCDVDLFRRYKALYMGGSTFRKMIPDFLPRQQQDTPATYALRVNEASYRPYVGQIVRAYAGALFASHYAIRANEDGEHVDLDRSYAALKEDCDGQGTDLTSFFKDRFREALVTAASYWLVELPNESAEELGLSEEEWRAQGHDRARLRALDTCSVVDWEIGNDGCFEWVKVHERTSRRNDVSSPAMTVDTWRVYYTDRVDVYQIQYVADKKPKPSADVPLINSYVHGFSRVPILSMRLPDGMWLLDTAADAQTEHFRLSCALGWALRRGAYPIGVFKLQSGSDIPKTGPGLGVVLGTEEEFVWAEPSGGTITQLREEIKSQKDEIFRVSQQMSMSADSSASAMGRSGLSKMADAEATSACLRDYASTVRESIEATYEMISNARGDFTVEFSVEGLSTFNAQDVESIIEAATSAKEFGIEDESDTFRVESHNRIASLVLPSDTAQETKDRIREEIENAKGRTGKDLGDGNKPQNALDESSNKTRRKSNGAPNKTDART